ncbi:hypothetical protein MRB53_028910 [Persea americana]|uniref:Uncharacterized protein n=1 Tax=Persea americana TaxID=3435 RepID=A0ACC2KGX7_PERAE|nr:hypothetical protein MRB53_028910 [Persea americana]
MPSPSTLTLLSVETRLLRNRVSAQQARERKKVYVNDLESKARELQDKNSKLEEKISTLTNENTMLRKVLMNTRPKVDESIEPQNDQSAILGSCFDLSTTFLVSLGLQQNIQL